MPGWALATGSDRAGMGSVSNLGGIPLKQEGEIQCPQCSATVRDLEKHMVEAHNLYSDTSTIKSVSNSSPPVTGAPYWEDEGDADQPMGD
jgi:hypothetical protein